jgi:hypothetical protein
MDDKLIDSLDWAIACLSTKKHEDDRAMVAVLKAHLDEVCLRKVVGELDGKPVRVGDVLSQPFPDKSLAMRIVTFYDGKARDYTTGGHIQFDKCRWPTKADFGITE